MFAGGDMMRLVDSLGEEVDPDSLAGAQLTARIGHRLGSAHFTPPTAKPTATTATAEAEVSRRIRMRA